MPEAIRQESPLLHFDPVAAEQTDFAATEQAFKGHINLRGSTNDAAFLAAVLSVLDLELPLEPNTVTSNGSLVAYWLGPDEWLLVMPGEREREIAQALRAALGESFAAVTVLSGGQTIVLLEGSLVRDVLARGCTLDLHPRAFGPGRCAQTLLGKAPVLIHQIDDTPRFELIVRRSFANYLGMWLHANANV